MGEMNTTGQQRGFSRVGGDFFAVLKDRRGRWRGGLSARFPKTSWRNLDIRTSVLAPGRNGPVATARFEMMREGLQESEARIFIEKALTDPAAKAKLGAALAQKCQEVLDERVRAIRQAAESWGTYMTWKWYTSPDLRERSEKLYAAAAEAAKKLEAK